MATGNAGAPGPQARRKALSGVSASNAV